MTKTEKAEKGRGRVLDYRQALGHFVENFAKVEAALQMTLWHYAKTPPDIARAVFSGTRADGAMSFIRRVLSVSPIEPEKKAEVEGLFIQLKAINDVRNSILHYGTYAVEEETGVTTNALVALTRAHERAFPISTGIIKAMTDDLSTILVRLRMGHMGLPPLPIEEHPKLAKRLAVPWQYKPPSSPDPKSQKPGKRDRAKGKARSDQHSPSHE